MLNGAHRRAVHNPRHLTPNFAGRSPPRAFRLLHGGCPPELAHQHDFEPDPMTLTVGSIYGSRTPTKQERSSPMIAQASLIRQV